MCVRVEYVLDGRPVVVDFDIGEACLPVKLRRGGVAFVKWGTRSPRYGIEENTPGHLLKWPETGWATLESIRADDWSKFDPRPVKVVVSRFEVAGRNQLYHWIDLRPGEYLQGLLAQIRRDKRVYIVTIPTPERCAHMSDRWPRIVRET